ncbi:MAG: hypothetical protein UV73_C0006G0010 [Candidatus Gottesmanbacteria bacterium GW2011_GWA2_43_14]|uniref:Uncharacterized protein n=1 Tax=Candidatus Gottesmanbacteria bacterium GW2011_GWA2_43_14 TaxID=1618443 RepID=A0A0G1FRL3_9BACT|nr:MAG: hypothetical protein UV73_C0006G0010 [Candidatus Gottesmanbacteria bacterium GW2011_GWA2_43_14]
MKKIILTAIFLGVFFIPQKAEAYAPPVFGYVKTKTGAPIAGIAIKWQDAENNSWFVFTDNTGYFRYPVYNLISKSIRKDMYNHMIDTDMDSLSDSRENSILPGDDEDKTYGGFGCSTNPHKITAVMPKSWKGAFSVPPPFEMAPGDELNNSMAEAKVVDIIYDPNAMPPVSVTPTGVKPPVSVTPASSCNCESMTVTNNLRVGELITISTKANTPVPDLAEVREMVYHVEKNGVEILKSLPLKAEEITGSYGRYQTSWKYRIPTGAESPGEYHVHADIICAKKTADNIDSDSRQSLWSGILGMFFQPNPISAQDWTSDVTVVAPSGVNSLQLGTFHPVVNLKLGCKDMYFTIR